MLIIALHKKNSISYGPIVCTKNVYVGEDTSDVQGVIVIGFGCPNHSDFFNLPALNSDGFDNR